MKNTMLALIIIFMSPTCYALSESLLRAIPAVCTADGNSNCSVKLKWDVTNYNSACLFFTIEGSSNNPKKVGCGKNKELEIPWIKKNKVYKFELKNGNNILAKTIVLGVEKSRDDFLNKETEKKEFNESIHEFETQELNQIRAASWDSRLLFGFKKQGGRSLFVKAFRSEALSEDRELFDGSFSEDVTIVEDDENWGISDALHSNVGYHLSVYPLKVSANKNNQRSNPYRSSAQGSFSNTGSYHSYEVGVIMSTPKILEIGENGDGTYIESDINVSATEKKLFLSHFKLKIIVSNPETAESSIHSTQILEKAKVLKDKEGNKIVGHEPSITLDGNLILFSATDNREDTREIGGSINYVYRDEGAGLESWEAPKNLAKMFWSDGAGAGVDEATVGGELFSKVYPIAASVIKEFDGEEFSDDKMTIKGAYPWISLDGADAVFSSVPGFHGSSRHGTTVVGARTNWVLRRIDGQMEPVRGNVLNHISGKLRRGTDKYNKMAGVYANSRSLSTGVSHGVDSWLSVINVPLGQFPSSWSPYSDNLSNSLPMNPFNESYGFMMFGNRYAEVSFPNLRDDLLVYFPMNEPYKYNHNLIRRCETFPRNGSSPTLTNCKKNGVTYQVDLTADYSGFSHTGELSSGAFYFYDYFGRNNKQTWTTWAQNGIADAAAPLSQINDKSSGRVGQSIYFMKKGKIVSKLSSEAIQKINNTQSFTTGMWFKPYTNMFNDNNRLIELQKIFNLKIINNKIKVFLLNKSNDYQSIIEHDISNLSNRDWHHISISYNDGHLKLFIDGELKKTIINNNLKKINVTNSNLVLGPGRTSGANQNSILYQLDEVYLYGISLPESEVLTLALKKEKHLSSEIPRDSSSVKKIELGKKLFNSKLLSSNKRVSCVSCHIPDLSFTDGKAIAVGLSAGSRNTPSIVDSRFLNNLHWDGSIKSLQSQVLHPIINSKEMGVSDISSMLSDLNEQNIMKSLLNEIYGNDKTFTLSYISELLSYFVASKESKTNGDDSAMKMIRGNSSVEFGRMIFKGKANCIACHNGDKLTDGKFHDIGILNDSLDRGFNSIIRSSSDSVLMKTPSLINISNTAPYFHDGSRSDLDGVIDFYNAGGEIDSDSRKIDPNIRPLGLTDSEKTHLINYLKSLDRDIIK